MLLLFCQQNPDTTIAATFCHFLSWSFCSVLKRSKDLLLRVSSLSLAPWYLKLFNNRASHVVNPDGSRLICTVVVMTEQIWGFSSLNWHFCNGTIKIGFITRQLCQKKDHWKEKNKKQQNPKKNHNSSSRLVHLRGHWVNTDMSKQRNTMELTQEKRKWSLMHYLDLKVLRGFIMKKKKKNHSKAATEVQT